jgi:hypothetical protein
MPEQVERTFIGRVHSINRVCDEDGDLAAYVMIESTGCHNTFRVLGDGSEWHPGQRVDVILRAVSEAPKEGE